MRGKPAALPALLLVLAGWAQAQPVGPGVAAPLPDRGQPRSPHLVRQIVADFKNTFVRSESLVILGAGLGTAWSASHFDRRIASSTVRSQVLEEETRLDEAFDGGQVLGGGLVQFGGAVSAFAMGKILSDPGAEDLGRDLVRAQILTQSLTLAGKFAAGRERPDGSNRKSFPSGHSSGAFATATVLQRHYGWSVGIPAYALAGYVATSRLTEAKHYLSDVVFGAAVGILAGRTVTLRLSGARFAVDPMLTTGGYGVRLTLLGSHRDARGTE